jgi:hypothetical protein
MFVGTQNLKKPLGNLDNIKITAYGMLIRCNYNHTVLLQSLHLPPFQNIPPSQNEDKHSETQPQLITFSSYDVRII